MPRHVHVSSSSGSSSPVPVNNQASSLLNRLGSPRTLIRLLRQVEAQNNELRGLNKDQQRQLADKENNNDSGASRGKRKGSRLLDLTDQDEVRLAACQFTYLSCLWVRNLKHTLNLDMDQDYDPSERFSDTARKCQGQFQEMLALIPEKLHCQMKNQAFHYLFKRSMDQQRSNGCKRVRHDAGTAIFKCLDEDLKTADTRFEKFSVLIGWTENDDGETAQYKAFAPILYKEDDGTSARERIFLNPILFRTWEALVQGPSKVKGGCYSGTRITLQSKWHIEEITPGAIATSAILARYAASADDQLQPKGSRTLIPYHEDFEVYLKYLTEGLRLKKKSVVNIFACWNEHFYGENQDTVKNITGKAHNSDLKAVFADLEDESEVDEGDQMKRGLEGGRNRENRHNNARRGQNDGNHRYNSPDEQYNDAEQEHSDVEGYHGEDQEYNGADQGGMQENSDQGGMQEDSDQEGTIGENFGQTADLPRRSIRPTNQRAKSIPPLRDINNMVSEQAASARRPLSAVDANEHHLQPIPNKRTRCNVVLSSDGEGDGPNENEAMFSVVTKATGKKRGRPVGKKTTTGKKTTAGNTKGKKKASRK